MTDQKTSLTFAIANNKHAIETAQNNADTSMAKAKDYLSHKDMLIRKLRDKESQLNQLSLQSTSTKTTGVRTK